MTGGEQNKKYLLPAMRTLRKERAVLYATERTHRFLEYNDIVSTLVHKIRKPDTPNLRKLLEDNVFDIIVNISDPSGKSKQADADHQLIKRFAIQKGTTLITSKDVARALLSHL